MRMDVLREYLVLFDTRSISAASQKLHISKSSLSKHLAALEDDLGTCLFERTQPLMPTPAGASFYEAAVSINEKYQMAKSRCHAIEERYPHFLTIGMLSRVKDAAFVRLHDALSDDRLFEARNYILSERVSSPEQLFSSLKKGSLALALFPTTLTLDDIREEYGLPDIRALELSQEPLMAVIPPTSPFSEKDAVTLKELANTTLLFDEGYHNFTKLHILLELFHSHGYTPRIRTISDNAFESFAAQADALDVIRIVPRSVLQLERECANWIALPIADAPAQSVYVIAKRSSDSTLLNDLMCVLESEAAM